jgi:hypothetical protein
VAVSRTAASGCGVRTVGAIPGDLHPAVDSLLADG